MPKFNENAIRGFVLTHIAVVLEGKDKGDE